MITVSFSLSLVLKKIISETSEFLTSPITTVEEPILFTLLGSITTEGFDLIILRYS